MSAKISFIVNEKEYVFEKLEDIPPYIQRYFTIVKYEVKNFEAAEERAIIARDCIAMLNLLLPDLPKYEVLEFERFFPVPPYRFVFDNKPLQGLLTPELEDDLITTCFHQFVRRVGFPGKLENHRAAFHKLAYYARLEVLEEIFANETNLKCFTAGLYSFIIKDIVNSMAHIYIILERQCTLLKKYLLENDIVRHIIYLQKFNETEDTFQLEARQWISKRATLICEKHFSLPIIERHLYNVREEFRIAPKLFEEGNFMDAMKLFMNNITTPGYGAHEMLSVGIVDSLLSYFMPSNKTESFNRARLFCEILCENGVDLEKQTEFNSNSKNLDVFLSLIEGLLYCLDILLQRLDKDPARQEAMEKCQHTIEDVCYMSHCVIEDENGLSEIIEKMMIMSNVNDLEKETNTGIVSKNCCPELDKEDDSSANVYNYCNLMKVGQLLNVLHSINNQWGSLIKVNGAKPLIKNGTFQSDVILWIPYRHEPWFYWKIVKKCRFLVESRGRVRLYLKNEMGIKFRKNEDILSQFDAQFNGYEYGEVDCECEHEHDDGDGDGDEDGDGDYGIEDEYIPSEYDELYDSEIWRSSDELDHSSYYLHVVSRQNILEDTKMILSNNPDFKSYWNFIFTHESGSGHGLTKEFYNLFSKDIQKYGIGHWLGTPAGVGGPHKHHDFISNGLFPSPLTSLFTEEGEDSTIYFTVLGKMLAKSLLDLQFLDIPFNRVLIKWLLSNHDGQRYIEVDDLKYIIPMQSDFIDQLIDVIKQKREIKLKYSQNLGMLNEALYGLTLGGCNFEDLCLNFTLPLFPEIEMKEGGADTLLSPHNVEEYLSLVMYWFFVKGPRKILQTIKEGFESVAPLSFLKDFYNYELESLLCSNEFQPWYKSELKQAFLNFCLGDKALLDPFFEVLSSFNSEEQRMFLQFVTSYSKLPPGGFEALPTKIIIQTLEVKNPDNYLPVSITCRNTLMLPKYSSVEITKEKLLMAIREAENSFQKENNFIQ